MTVSAAGAATMPSTTVRNSQARAGNHFSAAFAAAQTADTTTVRSPLLAAPLILPTRANVQQLASDLAQKLATRFATAGLAKTPAVAFTVDDQGGIRISGDRGDLARIQALVNGDAALQRSIRNTNAIASHAYEIESGGHLEFQRAYRLSADPNEIVAQYAYLFSGQPRTVAMSLGYSGGGVSIAAGGTTWLGG
jgi:hypothetical protein